LPGQNRAWLRRREDWLMEDELFDLLAARRGHFRLESGHHGDLWLDLELLCFHPAKVKRLAHELAERMAKFRIEMVCGPLVEGALVGLLVAAELGVEFSYSEPHSSANSSGLYPVRYRLPVPLRSKVGGKRVAIVNDVINAGSAVRGTVLDLTSCGANPVAIGALLILGDSIRSFAAANNLNVESIAAAPNVLWEPAVCPLCAANRPLDN